MELNQAEIVLRSKINNNSYYLFKEKIVVKEEDGTCRNILLPNNVNIICFYDMYYSRDGLRVIIATRSSYDFVGILDENDLTLSLLNLTK